MDSFPWRASEGFYCKRRIKQVDADNAQLTPGRIAHRFEVEKAIEGYYQNILMNMFLVAFFMTFSSGSRFHRQNYQLFLGTLAHAITLYLTLVSTKSFPCYI